MNVSIRRWLVSLSLVSLGCVPEAPYPSAPTAGLRISEEVFRMFCKRIAREEHPEDASGVRFDAPCEGRAAQPPADGERLHALVVRRGELVGALDQLFGDPREALAARFVADELHDFLGELVPFYDPPEQLLPEATRALGRLLARSVDESDEGARQLIGTLERFSRRKGYRPEGQNLGLLAPLLAYPRLDQLTEQLLDLVGPDGAARAPFLELLSALTLTLAEPGSAAETESTLRVANQLLLGPLTGPAEGNAAPYVQRDEEGFAHLAVGVSEKDAARVTPFPVSGQPDAARDSLGRALRPDGSGPLFRYGDAEASVLAALLRELKPLVERGPGASRSTVERLSRGLRPLLGPERARSERFGTRELTFRGPDVEHAPLLELVHALSMLAAYPETERALALFGKLLREHESSVAGPLYVGLQIDRRADAHPEAQLLGLAGAGSAHELWDDLIEIGRRMLERPGLLDAVTRAFADPRMATHGDLYATFMEFRDRVGYHNAPIKLTGDKLTAAQAEDVNHSPLEHTFVDRVDRTRPDVGMNRSILQRTLSLFYANNGAPNCNKQGATLSIEKPLPLTFPNPASTSPLVGSVVNVLCPPVGTRTAYEACALIRQPNGTEAQLRSILGKTRVVIKDKQLTCAAGTFGIDLGSAQAEAAQLEGLTLTPTPQAVARLIYAPRNRFLSDIFAPNLTVDAVPLIEYEPDALFPPEVPVAAATVAGKPLSFLSAVVPLVEAFDRHELFEQTEDGEVATRGYLFADAASVLHRHWSSRKSDDCPAEVRVGNEGCTQSLHPDRPFYAPQTNLVSYEPLLIEAFRDERLFEVLHRSVRSLLQVEMVGPDGVQRDGVRILAELLERVLRSDAALRYRDGRSYVTSNTCRPLTDPNGAVTCAEGQGRVLPEVSPLYLVLDALAAFDRSFEEPSNKERLQPYRDARGALVDQLLDVERLGPSSESGYRLKNRRLHGVLLASIDWLGQRLGRHRETGDLTSWAADLPGRLAKVLGHPITARLLDLLDHAWDKPEVGAELAGLLAYLSDPGRSQAEFSALLISLADGLALLERDPALTPLFRFAARGIAENALEALDNASVQPAVEAGPLERALEVTRRLVAVDPGPAPSTLSKLLANLVQRADQPRTPLEQLAEAIADINRAQPLALSSSPLEAADLRSVLGRLESFLSDEEHGLERLYRVIQERNL